MGSVCCFLLLSTLSCSVDTFSCELWYLRCSVVGSHSIAMYELLQPNCCSLHFITQPWQNLLSKSYYSHYNTPFDKWPKTTWISRVIHLQQSNSSSCFFFRCRPFQLYNVCWHRRPMACECVWRFWECDEFPLVQQTRKYCITIHSKLNKKSGTKTKKGLHNLVSAFLPWAKHFS